VQPIAVVDHRNAHTAKELISLQRRAYAVEAELIGYDRLPPLVETVQDLMGSALTVLAAVESDALVGLLGYTLSDGVVDVDRIAVDPGRFRRGHARRLLDALHERHPACDVVVSTGADNAPAIALYESLGYLRVGQRTVADTLAVVDFRRPSTSP
jgi:ribosomal protein S18 acetylase RimI-like enzyme